MPSLVEHVQSSTSSHPDKVVRDQDSLLQGDKVEKVANLAVTATHHLKLKCKVESQLGEEAGTREYSRWRSNGLPVVCALAPRVRDSGAVDKHRHHDDLHESSQESDKCKRQPTAATQEAQGRSLVAQGSRVRSGPALWSLERGERQAVHAIAHLQGSHGLDATGHRRAQQVLRQAPC